MPTTILHGETYEEALYRRFSEEAEFINKIFTRKTEMSKELIDRIRELQAKDWASPNEVEAAALIEQQQSWIESLEQNARDADRMYKELETELAEQQKRIDELEADRERMDYVCSMTRCDPKMDGNHIYWGIGGKPLKGGNLRSAIDNELTRMYGKPEMPKDE